MVEVGAAAAMPTGAGFDGAVSEGGVAAGADSGIANGTPASARARRGPSAPRNDAAVPVVPTVAIDIPRPAVIRTSVGRFGSNVRANGTKGPRLLKVSCAGSPGRKSAQVANPTATTTASATTTSGTTPMLRPFSITAANWWLIARVTGRTCRSVPPGTAGRCSTSARSCATTVAGSSRSRTRSVTAVSGRTTRGSATTGSGRAAGGSGRAAGGLVAPGFESARGSVVTGVCGSTRRSTTAGDGRSAGRSGTAGFGDSAERAAAAGLSGSARRSGAGGV